ncbi:uncharacterized protein [Apostichopus japonicus]|uniref:uncharacterized protein isoform X2 n=1 Tax=Stichopus japonicus TaxID=307972 RepID=UPI003AB439E7
MHQESNMEATIYMSFRVFLIFNMAHAVIPAAVLNYRKAVNGSVLLNACHTWENNSLDWKFQNALLFFEHLLLRPEFNESLHLFQNKSLFIQPISLLNIGKYECIKNHETLQTYFLDVEVPPTLSVTVDGHSYHDNGDTFYIPYNTTISVSCYATGSRPPVNISITVDNVEISPSDSNTTTNAILNGSTFDSRMRFSLQTTEETGNISCHSSSLSYFPEQRLDVTYSTYVPPMMSLKINEFPLNQSYFWVPQYRRTVITCFAWNARPNVNLSWLINDRDRIYTQKNVTEGDTKLYNSQSLLDYIPTQYIETISCYGNNVISSEYHVGVSLYTYVPPRMSLKINEFPLNQSYVWVPQYELMVITCFAWEARPKMNLSWVINNRDRIYTKTNVTEGDTQIYNSKSLLHYRPTQENEKISCYGNSVTSSEYHVGVSLYTYVFPQLYITLNGERTDKKYVSAGENLTVICHADGARPTAVLSFNDRNEVVTEMTPTTNASRRITFVLINPLKEENVTCTSTQRRDSERDLKTSVTVTVTLSDESTTQPTLSGLDIMNRSTTEPHTSGPQSSGFGYLQWIILSIAILLTCFLFVCIYKITMKIRDADTTLGGSTQLQLNTLPAEQSLLQNPLQGSLKNKQKSDLPSIPIDESNSIHSSGSESNYYSAAEDRGTKDRIFTESEFCILLAIKVGTIYNRWMGTIRMSSDVNKCAVLTTITEGITKKKIIHWNSFVKRTLDLPTTDRLTRIEGIAVDKTNLYLVTEHSVCETLESRLTFDPSSHSSPFLVLDVMKHITAIVEGIECLQSFGFLHPGLSTKKILYTKEGICKLYDFCLAEDASKIVTIKKTQMNTVSFNQFPPESFFRNEYSAESDVWSTAVVIWEILSMGDSPFPVDEDIKPGQDVKAPTLNWPQRYFQLRNLVLFDCWSQTCSLRPSIHHLKESFKAIFETLIENSFYEIPLSESYMPMGGTAN